MLRGYWPERHILPVTLPSFLNHEKSCIVLESSACSARNFNRVAPILSTRFNSQSQVQEECWLVWQPTRRIRQHRRRQSIRRRIRDVSKNPILLCCASTTPCDITWCHLFSWSCSRWPFSFWRIKPTPKHLSIGTGLNRPSHSPSIHLIDWWTFHFKIESLEMFTHGKWLWRSSYGRW